MRTGLTRLLAVATLLVGAGIFGPVKDIDLGAAGDQCAALGGILVPPVTGECQVSANVARTGTFNLNETLHVFECAVLLA